MKNLYIILSKTNTKVAKTIRMVAKQNYSHVSISLEDDFSHIYAFARPQHNALLLAGLVEENLDRFTLRKNNPIPVKVLKLNISDEEYEWIQNKINQMHGNSDYMYNLYSILTYPFAKGISVKDAFTCVEFAVYLLQHLGYLRHKPSCKFRPDDLAQALDNYSFFEGDAREILPYAKDDNYFSKVTIKLIANSVYSFIRISKRSLFHFKSII